MTQPLIIIPARLESTRLPGKLLSCIASRPLIEWTWRNVREAGWPTLIATDSPEIAEKAEAFGARVVMTGPANNGTERCALALDLIPDWPDIIINWQGDNPLPPPSVAAQLADAIEFGDADVATPVCRLAPPRRPAAGQAVALKTAEDRTLYFSRVQLPPPGPWSIHVGLYAIRAEALRQYGRDPTPLELAEQLEQLRWLERGYRVRCVEIEGGPWPEVNLPGDLEKVRDHMIDFFK